MKQDKLTIDHNSCFLSSTLLDELDYVIGGYGQPTAEFIFNLNSFIESFILSSNFILSKQDYDHIKITKSVLFPNGRPIFELLLKKEIGFSIIQGLGNNIMQCVYVEDNVATKTDAIVDKMIEKFAARESEAIKEKLIISDLTKPIESVTTYTVGFGKNQAMIGQTFNRPFEIVKKLFDTVNNYNVQAGLPVFTYKQQIEELNKKEAVSKEIYDTLCFIQGEQIKNAEEYLGHELQVIPPLVNIVLSKCKNREDIPDALLEIRNDFTEFRECCETYEKNLFEAKSIKEQLEAINEFKGFWNILVKKYSEPNSRILYRFVDVAKEGNIENSLENVLDNETTDSILKDLNLVKLAGKAGALAMDRIKQRRVLNKFKGVTNMWSLLGDSPTIELQLKNVERVFGVEIDQQRLSNAKKYLATIKNAPNNT